MLVYLMSQLFFPLLKREIHFPIRYCLFFFWLFMGFQENVNTACSVNSKSRHSCVGLPVVLAFPDLTVEKTIS